MSNPQEDKLLGVFKVVDKDGSGKLPLANFYEILERIGIVEGEAEKLIVASRCHVADGNVEYGSFCSWLFKEKEAIDRKQEPALSNEQEEQANAERFTDSGFGNWIDRCVHALEDQHEADYVHKKQLVAQMHNFMDHLKDVQQARAERRNGSKQQAVTVQGVLRARDMAKKASARKEEAKHKPTGPLPLCKPSYEAPKLEWDGVAVVQKTMIEGPASIPLSFVEEVLNEMLKLLTSNSNCVRHGHKAVLRFAVPEAGRVVVVGDTHGQLQDVLLVFLLQGMPSSQNVFLFNGNIADRGSEACTIFIILFVFFLCDPNCIVIHRGNHEDNHMNELSVVDGGGFLDECLEKYGPQGKGIFKKFIQIFKLLPLCSVVSDEVFVTHGGLWRGDNQRLEFANAINHKKVCCPSTTNNSDSKDLAFLDLLWAEPQESYGCTFNRAKYGISWGPDVTERFLTTNKLKTIIRSKKLPTNNRGWCEHHLGRVYTVFSASNFMGQQHNWGAVAILSQGEGDCLSVSFAEHNIPSLEALGPLSKKLLAIPAGPERDKASQQAGLTHVASDQDALLERRIRATLDKLGCAVIERKPELWKAFHEVDLDGEGVIQLKSWTKIMSSIGGNDLPWEGAAAKWFGSLGENENLDYRDFLDKFQITLSSSRWCGWKALVLRDMYHVLLNREHSMPSQIFETFDTDGDGLVTEEEFKAVISETTGRALTSSQLDAMTKTVFSHAKDGKYDVEDFLSRFTMACVQAENMGFDDESLQSAIDPALQTILDQIGNLICQRLPGGAEIENLSQTFRAFDDSNDGFLQLSEFVRHIKELPGFEDLRHDGKPLDDKSLLAVAECIASGGGQSHDGMINLLEFYRAFQVVEHTLSTDVYEHILTFLYRHRHALRTSCSNHDFEHAGRVSQDDFASVLEALNLLTSRPERSLTQAQVDALSACLAEDDGFVEYEAFLAAFQVEVLSNH